MKNFLKHKIFIDTMLLIQKWEYFKRELVNFKTVLVPWERRIKQIESQFGSAVASYFIFLRWLFWFNIVLSAALVTFVAIPEVRYVKIYLTLHKNFIKAQRRVKSIYVFIILFLLMYNKVNFKRIHAKTVHFNDKLVCLKKKFIYSIIKLYDFNSSFVETIIQKYLISKSEKKLQMLATLQNATIAGDRKIMLPEEKAKSNHLLTLWEFEGDLKYSPFFYGWYANQHTYKAYKLPLVYFVVNLVVYIYSFVAILRK